MRINDQHLSSIGFEFDSRGHFRPFVSGLIEGGFSVSALPTNGSIQRNAQIVVLDIPGRKLRFRIYIYKVTESSRGRPDERRVEITNTYPKKNIRHIRGAHDVVLGWDYEHEVFVGLDPARLEYGGPTGNASSFFDGKGLTLVSRDEILVRPHRSTLFATGYEFHAFFERRNVADYLTSLNDIHTGQYRGESFLTNKVRLLETRPARQVGVDQLIFTTARRQRRKEVSKRLVESAEKGIAVPARKRRVSTKEFAEVKKTCEENGRLGEEYVLEREKLALSRSGRPDLASRVEWTSETSVFAGYDILSFFKDGRRKYIEVKSTSGDGKVFQISIGEWNFGLKHGDNYFIYRVTQVTSKRPKLKTYCNVKTLEDTGLLTKSPSGWTIRLK